MTTTHDRTFTTERFPAKRNIPRNEPETDKVPKSTMKQDFDYKQATEKVMPYLPPGKTRQLKTFSNFCFSWLE